MRPATADDMPALIEMGRKFHAAAALPWDYNAAASAASIQGMIDRGCVLMTEAGAIGGIIAPAWSNPEWLYACELFWWAEDGRGRDLLRGFEDWARRAGASEVRMTSLEHLRAADVILRRSGYAVRELSYGKVM